MSETPPPEARLAGPQCLFSLPARAQSSPIDRVLLIEAALAQRIGVTSGNVARQPGDSVRKVHARRELSQQIRQSLDDQRHRRAERLGTGEMRVDHVDADSAPDRGVELGGQRRVDQLNGEPE